MHTFLTHDPVVSLMDLPYTVTDHPTGRTISLHRDAVDSPFLIGDSGQSCVDGITGDELLIDCALIHQANSVLIAWLIRVAGIAKPKRVTLIGVSPRQVVLFQRMRLDHLVQIRSS